MNKSQFDPVRINKLEEILIKLHEGASPESVQEEFNQHFDGVSAMEISLMEHQLMYSEDSRITFEDVLQLCNVHANLFKQSVREGETFEADLPGHPVQIFKEENMALRATTMRIKNILNTLRDMPVDQIEEGLLRGLKRQYDLMGSFDIHYERKEKVFFPLMERYGHDAPPKVMWGKDDEIRDLFKQAYRTMTQYPETSFAEMIQTFESFEFEFNEMIFKEESILLNILLEILDTKDWYQIAQESDPYGYAIIRPNEKWEPNLLDAPAPKTEVISEDSQEHIPVQSIETKKIALAEGNLTLIWEPKFSTDTSSSYAYNLNQKLQIGDGLLSIIQLQRIMEYLPMEISIINAEDIVTYSNVHLDWETKYLSRDFQTLGRSIETIYPKDIRPAVENIVKNFKSGQRSKQMLSYDEAGVKRHITLLPLADAQNNYLGYAELFFNLNQFDHVDRPMKRALRELQDIPPFTINTTQIPDFTEELPEQDVVPSSKQALTIPFANGEFHLQWLDRRATYQDYPRNRPITSPYGSFTLEIAQTILDALPFEVTFVDHTDHFQYYNNIVPYEAMIFKRTPAQVGRNLELCHPPFLWPTVKQLIQDFREQKRREEFLWYQTKDGRFIYILYQAIYDQEGKFFGILETVLNMQDYLDQTFA